VVSVQESWLWKFVDPRAVENENLFEIAFTSHPTTYSVKDLNLVEEEIYIKLNQFVRLDFTNIDSSSFILKALNGNTTYTGNVDYELIPSTGQIRGIIDRCIG